MAVRPQSQLVVSSTQSLDRLICALQNAPLLTQKSLYFFDLVRIIDLKRAQAHKTPQGLALIRSIKEGLNTGRKTYS